jgi:transcriptional regulator with XRE-family HTH domain
MPAPNEPLRAARRQKRWSQQTAAEKIGIDRKTYLRLETRQTDPQTGTLDLICTAFGLSAEELGFESTQQSGSRAMVQIMDVAPATLTLRVDTNDMPDFPIKVSMILAHIMHMIGA